MADNLQQQIQALNEEGVEKVQMLEYELQETELERDDLRHRIEELRSELAYVDSEYRTIQEYLDEVPERWLQINMGALVVGALETSENDLFAQLHAIQQIHELGAQLNSEIPNLEQAMKEVLTFEKNRAQLDALPESYRASLLAHHEQRKEQLRPNFELRELKQHVAAKPLKIVLLLISNPQESQINWVLPLPAAVEEYPAEISALIDEFSEMAIYVILRLGQHGDWYYASMDDEPASWQGFCSQVTLMEYSGNVPMAEHAGQLLQQQFDALLSSDQSGPLQGLRIVVETASIAHEALQWQLEPETLPESEAVPEPDQPLPPLIERSNGWYSEADVTAWERPLKVTEASAWNVQGRRLRTAMINLLSRGHMGTDFVEQLNLWQALPQPHQEAMREGIDLLVGQEILYKVDGPNGNGEGLIAINPAKIGHVQDIINRQVDEFWQSIMQTKSESDQ